MVVFLSVGLLGVIGLFQVINYIMGLYTNNENKNIK